MCGGGVDVNNVLFKEETNPKPRPTKPTLGITGEYCIDTPKWDPSESSEFISSCESYWFKQKDEFVTCAQYGHIKAFDGSTGNNACCICGGGYNGTLIGHIFRVTFPSDSDDHITLNTNNVTGDKEGTIVDFLHEASNATGFGMYFRGLSDSALSKYPNDTYLACEYDLSIGSTDICVGPFWSDTEDDLYSSTALFEDEFYLIVKKPQNSFLRQLFLPILPMTPKAWVSILIVSLYVVIALSIISGSIGRSSSIKSIWNDTFLVCFNCLMNLSGGTVANERDESTVPEKIIYASYAIFGLIFLTAYTAVSAAFLVVGLEGANSLDDVINVGGSICVQERAFSSLVSEHPQTGSLAKGKLGYSTLALVEDVINEDCFSAVVTTDAFIYVADEYDGNVCDQVSFLPSEVIFTLSVVLPTYELLEDWGAEFINQVNSFIEAGVYTRITDQQNSSPEYQNENRKRLLRSGGSKGAAGGGATGSSSSSSVVSNVVCKSEAVDLDDPFQITAENLLMPIFLVVTATSISICIYLYTKYKKSKHVIDKIESKINDYDGTIYHQKINKMSVMELFELLKDLNVDALKIRDAANILPDKRDLVELVYLETCSVDQRDMMILFSLDIFELYEVILYCQQMNIDTEKSNLLQPTNDLECRLNDKENPKKELVEFLMKDATHRRTAVYCARRKESCTCPDKFSIVDCFEKLDTSDDDLLSRRWSLSKLIELDLETSPEATRRSVRERRIEQVKIGSYDDQALCMIKR